VGAEKGQGTFASQGVGLRVEVGALITVETVAGAVVEEERKAWMGALDFFDFRTGDVLVFGAEVEHDGNKSDCYGESMGLGWLKIRFPEVSMKVSELIGSRKEVYFISEEATVMEAAKYLRERQVRSVGVMNAAGKLAGVISQSDISDKVAAENKCPAWIRVSEIMTRELLTVTPEMTFEESLRAMEQNGVYHLLILDGQQHYRGMLSVSDLLKVLATDQKGRADLLESYMFPLR
jgi:CBS domain-containing protein